MTFEEYRDSGRLKMIFDESLDCEIQAMVYGEEDDGSSGHIQAEDMEGTMTYCLTIYNVSKVSTDIEPLVRQLWDDYAQFNYED